VSLVFELQSEPRQVTSARPDAVTLQIDAGPMPSPASAQQWSAPDGVHLLHTVTLETLAAQGGLHYLRAHVTLPEFAKANVRTEGRRVYVDLTWPLDAEDSHAQKRPTPYAVQDSDRRSTAVEREPGSAATKQGVKGLEEQYRGAIEPMHRRITEVKPFLVSAAQSGSIDVYAALDQTLASIEASLTSMNVPAAEAGQHQLLLAATRSARHGLEPGYPGDRLAQVQKAITMFEGAMAAPVIQVAP
jgi:hypothetical protein